MNVSLFKRKNTNDLKSKKKDLIHIEFIRIIAIYLVLFNHTGKKGYALFTTAKDSPLYWVYLFISVLDKIAVPLFFMISGALLLGKEEKIIDVYRKRILKIIVALVVSSLCYNVYFWYFKGSEFNLLQALINIYSKNTAVALWYLYSYVGMLVMLPLLRKLANAMDDKEYIYLFVCQVVIVGVIPIVQYLASKGNVSLNPRFTAALFTQFNIFYVLIGYYVEKKLDQKYFNKKNVYISLIVSFVAIAITCLMAHYKIYITGVDKESEFSFHSSLISIPTVSIYFAIKYAFSRIKLSEFNIKLISFLGGTTFGIYLIEGMLRERTLFIFDYLKPIMHTLPATIIWIAASVLIGVVITAILKKIPVVKKYL